MNVEEFDFFRDVYGRLTFAEKKKFYTRMAAEHPGQSHHNKKEALKWLSGLANKKRVLELGGWDGELAESALETFPEIESWTNWEIVPAQTFARKHDPRYDAPLVTCELWESSLVPDNFDAFISAHAIEHLSDPQVSRLLYFLRPIRNVFLESPLRDGGQDWRGGTDTHVLQMGWREIEIWMGWNGLSLVKKEGDIRTFTRDS